MLKLGKILASSALGLTMGLSLLSPAAFAQSVTSSKTSVSARTNVATTAVRPLGGRVPGGDGGDGCGGGYGNGGGDGCGEDGYYNRPRPRCEKTRVQVVVGVRQH